MSAFGRRNGVGGMQPGARPAFGVARPMKTGLDGRPAAPGQGGDQFPPLPEEAAHTPAPVNKQDDAMARLSEGCAMFSTSAALV